MTIRGAGGRTVVSSSPRRRPFAHSAWGLVGLTACALGLAAACSSSDEAAPGGTTPPAEDGGIEAATSDAPAEALDEPETGPPPSAVCATLGLPSRAWIDAKDDATLFATAADVTIPTTTGDFDLKARFSGCDSYLFVQDTPAQNDPSFGYGIWDVPDDLQALFEKTPKNVHFFFTSYRTDDAARAAALSALQANVEAVLANLTASEQAWWSDRVHYVGVAAKSLPGWLGKTLSSPKLGAAVDRLQRVRYLGSYADPTKVDSSKQWPFGPNVSMLANEAVYYDYEAEREDRLAAENATVVSLWKETAVSKAPSPYIDVTLPDAATMATFDSVELDLTMNCEGTGDITSCPAWDYNTYLSLCDDAPPDGGVVEAGADDAGADGAAEAGLPEPNCTTELGHWITSYHREGRWVHDVSGILPLLANGGTRRFKMSIGDPWVVTLSLRFFSQGKAAKPSETIPLFVGEHDFDDQYNANYAPKTIAIPADAKKVEIASVITGHGMSQPGNCAEFCNTDHHFLVNGTDNVRSFPMAGNSFGCMDQVKDGTVPNQYGTWWYGRDGWCPGKHVPMVLTDVTNEVTKGADNTFEYQGYWKGKPYTGGDNWRYIHLASWLVISR